MEAVEHSQLESPGLTASGLLALLCGSYPSVQQSPGLTASGFAAACPCVCLFVCAPEKGLWQPSSSPFVSVTFNILRVYVCVCVPWVGGWIGEWVHIETLFVSGSSVQCSSKQHHTAPHHTTPHLRVAKHNEEECEGEHDEGRCGRVAVGRLCQA